MAVLSTVALLRPEPAADPPRVLRTTVAPPVVEGSRRNDFGVQGEAVVSPNGRSLVFAAGDQLWIRPLSDVTPTPISGTEGARLPFWSPDGEALGFFADGSLKRVAVDGGAVSTICAAVDGRGASWGPEGKILFTPGPRTGIYAVDATGGEPWSVTDLDPGVHTTHRWPLALPGGDHFVFLATSHRDPRGLQNGIYVASISGAVPRMLTPADAKPELSAGHLLFLRAGTLLAQRFDFAGLALVDEPFRVVQGVRYRGESWSGSFSASRQEVLAYAVGSRDLESRLAWIDRLGNEEAVLDGEGLHWDLRASPLGDRVAVARGTPEPELWLYDLASRTSSPLTVETSFNRAPVWSPDGERLAYAAMNGNGRLNMYTVSSRGLGSETLLMESKQDQVPTSWSADGQWLAFEQGSPGATEVWVMPLSGDEEPFPVVQDPPWAGEGQFSPDGRWLLFTSRVSGVDQVYIASFPDAEGRWLLSRSGGARGGRWSQGGDRVFFATPQSMLMEVEVRRRKKDGGLDVGMPRMLFSYRRDDSLFRGFNSFYDVVGDGERFVFVRGPERRQDQGLVMLVFPWLIAGIGG